MTKACAIRGLPDREETGALNIDFAPDGTVYGVELLNANEQLTRDHGALIVESGGQRQEITLVA